MTEEELLKKVEALEDLAIQQNEALGMANGLLDLKDQLITLCEEETKFYKTQNKRLITSLIISGILFAILGVLNLIRLFI